MTIRRFAGVLSVALISLHALSTGATEAPLAAPGAPTILVASGGDGSATVTYLPPADTGGSPVTRYHLKAYRQGVVDPVASALVDVDPSSPPVPLTLQGLTNGVVYRLTLQAAVSGGAVSELSNTVIPATRVTTPLDPTVTYILPSWSGLLSNNGEVNHSAETGITVKTMAARLRSVVGDGPKAKIGLSVFVQLAMPDWNVVITGPNATAAMEKALESTMANIDAAIKNAKEANVDNPLPIGISLITAIRERTDGVEAGAFLEDQRNLEWYTDQTRAAGWMTFSQYARKMRRIKEAYIRTFGRLLADRIQKNPNILVAVTGDGEIEMTYEKFRAVNDPVDTATRSWADYSPFAIAEFRDWLTGRGDYAAGGPLAAHAYRFASRYTTDSAPNVGGADSASLNGDFGTAFTSWDLKYDNFTFDSNGDPLAPITALPTSCAAGLSLDTTLHCALAGGFDAPRPNPSTILSQNSPFWHAFRLFRDQMVNRYNRDFARWITEGTAVVPASMSGLLDTSIAGVPYDRFYSAQVPTDRLFGFPAADGGVRALTSGSPWWSADIFPYGGMGVTGYNTNANGDAPSGNSGNSGGYYDRTVNNVAPLVAARSRRWSIVEWNPSDPFSTCPDIYRADNLIVRQYRPTLLMPYKIDTSDTQYQRVLTSPTGPAVGFETGLKELMMGVKLSSSPAPTANCGKPQSVPLVDAPGIAQPTGQSRGGWLPIVTWENPAPIFQGTTLAGVLNATANMPGTFAYRRAANTTVTAASTLPAATYSLTARFTPDDSDYAEVEVSVPLQVNGTGGTVAGKVTVPAGALNARVEAVFVGGTPAPNSVTLLSTDSSGRFALAPIPPGRAFQIYVSAHGHVRQGYPGVPCPGTGTCPGVLSQSLTLGQTLSDVDFTMVRTGSVTGNVANAVSVILRHPTYGEWLVATESGSFVVFDVPPGTYALSVTPNEGFVHTAVFSVTVTAGAGTVVNPTVSAGGGQISGRVSNTSNGDLAGVTVGVFDLRGQLAAETVSGSGGTYTTPTIPAGNYYVKTTANGGGYVNQLYRSSGGIPCDGCPVFGGTRVGVSNLATTSNINFSLASGGILRGSVVNATLDALPGITVRVLNELGAVVGSAVSGADGTYSVTGLATGRYYARTANALRYIDRIWTTGGGADCLTCGPASGNPIAVTTGSIRDGINFSLSAGGSIAGALTGESSAALVGAGVRVFRANNQLIEEATTDGLGQYRTTVGLPPGNYYIRTNNGQGYNDELYDDNGCVACLPNSGVAVTVGGVQALDRTGINFALLKGGWVEGAVLAGTTPLANVRVEIFRLGLLAPAGTATTDVEGKYRTTVFSGGGTYFAVARGRDGYFSQIWRFTPGIGYDGIDCVECIPSQGTGFGVSNGAPTAGINFALHTGAQFSGLVTATGGAAISGVRVLVFNANAERVAVGVTGAGGNYTTEPSLPAGSYYLQTSNTAGYLDEAFDNIPCANCTGNTGNAVSLSGGQTFNANFVLASGGRIAGSVINSQSNGIPGAVVNFYNLSGGLVTSATAGPDGAYITSGTLRPGLYFARAFSAGGYLPSLYDVPNCGFCPVSRGNQIEVKVEETREPINFTLQGGSSIEGTVTSTAGVPLAGVTVEIRTGQNALVNRITTDAQGRYVSAFGLPNGSYFVQTRNLSGFVDQVYNAKTCVGCIATSTGDAIVTTGSDVTHIDFVLLPAGLISGTVTTKVSNVSQPLAGITIDVYNSRRLRVQIVETDANGTYTTLAGLPAGDYYVRTRNSRGYIDEVYNNTNCLACDPTTGAKVTISGTDSRTGIDFELAAGGGISGRVTTAAAVAIGRVNVLLFNRVGSQITQTTTNGDGDYRFTGLPDGNYFVKTRNALGYLDEAFDDVRCGAGCNPALSLSTIVAVFAGATTTGKNFALDLGGLVRLSLVDQNKQPLALTRVTFVHATNPSCNVAASTDDGGGLDVSLCAGQYTVTVAAPGASGRGLQFATSAVTVNAGQETQVSLTATSCTPPAFSTTALASGKAGTAYSQALAASGGSGTLTYSVYDGQLAPGLSINASSGAIGGTPSTSGTSNFTLGVADSTGCTGTADYAITIAAADPVNGATSPTTLKFGAIKNGSGGALSSVTAAQSVTVTFTGGSPEWSVSANQPWLQLSTSSGLGAGSFTASIVNPSNVIAGSTSLSATISITGSGITNTPLTIPVTLTIDQTNGATKATAIGQVDTPSQNATDVVGAIGVTGWALDNIGIAHVKIYRPCLGIDNPLSCQTILGQSVVFVGDAAFLPGARPDVEAAFSAYPNGIAAGWGMQILTNMLPHIPNSQLYGGQGALTLYVYATDLEGNIRLLGRSSDPLSADYATPTFITMGNDTIAKPFGTIDTPALGGTISGTIANFGWVLTPDSNTTAGEAGDILMTTSGAGMVVYIDGVATSTVAYNQCRGTVGNPPPAGVFCNDDIANIFGTSSPQPSLTLRTSNPTRFRNLDATRSAIGAYVMNTTLLSNGRHQIAWGVADSAARGEGIGSRFFTVLNSGADQRTEAQLRNAPAEILGQAVALDRHTPGTEGVYGRTGYALDHAWKTMHANAAGGYTVRLPESGRLELWLGEPAEAGYLVANGTLRPLPVGATLAGSYFAWMPPVGYVGPYTLAFVRGNERIDVTVTVAPVAPTVAGESEVQMFLDPVRVEGPVLTERSVRVEGWAFDPKAPIESGIGAVHVWAKRASGPGVLGSWSPGVPGAAAPVFLGEATLDVARPDVANAHAGASGHAGYQLTATLGAGTWELTAYVWNDRTARWEDARTVTVTVR
jgi:hypothetical protein